MQYKLILYLEIFLAGGFFGWIVDTASRSYNASHFAPGTMVPFFSLIFAAAAVLLFILFSARPIPFWFGVILGTLICITLELSCGFISQVVFNHRFWDYSTKPYNFYGFIDLRHSTYWFILTLLYRSVVNRWVKKRVIQQIYVS